MFTEEVKLFLHRIRVGSAFLFTGEAYSAALFVRVPFLKQDTNVLLHVLLLEVETF